MGREVLVAITQGRLDFGPWQQVFTGEFDGRRGKRVLVKIIGEWKLLARRSSPCVRGCAMPYGDRTVTSGAPRSSCCRSNVTSVSLNWPARAT